MAGKWITKTNIVMKNNIKNRAKHNENGEILNKK